MKSLQISKCQAKPGRLWTLTGPRMLLPETRFRLRGAMGERFVGARSDWSVPSFIVINWVRRGRANWLALAGSRSGRVIPDLESPGHRLGGAYWHQLANTDTSVPYTAWW